MKLMLSLLLLAATMVVGHGQGYCRPSHYLTRAASPDSKALPPTPKTCEDGPLRVIHTDPDYFYWPPIYKGSCDKLSSLCKDPPCIVRKRIWRWRCVLAYKIDHGIWKRVGFRHIRFIDDLSCSCKKCSDIKNVKECVATKPCPNSKVSSSFCFYKPNKCDCCVPYPCPKGQEFDDETCSCVRVCPKGSKKVGDKCVGTCSDIKLSDCKSVFCDINPKFYCAVDNYKCVCPSCDAQRSASQCPRTRCVEQSGNPYCVYDSYSRKCRCPRCSDIKDKRECLNAYCEDGSPRCKYNDYSRKCFCPEH